MSMLEGRGICKVPPNGGEQKNLGAEIFQKGGIAIRSNKLPMHIPRTAMENPRPAIEPAVYVALKLIGMKS